MKKRKAMKRYLKFWGTRGSCSVSGPEYLKFGGNSCSLEIVYDDVHIIIDAGTGIRALGSELLEKQRRKIDILLTHTHWDHIIGFPFFDPIYETGTQVTIWSPNLSGRSCKQLFNDLLAIEFFPVRLEEVKAHLDFRTIQQKTPISFGPITLDFHMTNHPGLAYGVKIKTPTQTIGYITDNEMLQGFHGELEEITPETLEPHRGLIDFFQGCDILMHEAQYFSEEYLEKVGWGHSSAQNAIVFIRETSPKQWGVIHHDPKHTDKDLENLAQITQNKLRQHQIDCPVKWIPDGHVLPLR
jgi:phosphoribosyl 1,2-cyclic phosphodiesterase